MDELGHMRIIGIDLGSKATGLVEIITGRGAPYVGRTTLWENKSKNVDERLADFWRWAKLETATCSILMSLSETGIGPRVCTIPPLPDAGCGSGTILPTVVACEMPWIGAYAPRAASVLLQMVGMLRAAVYDNHRAMASLERDVIVVNVQTAKKALTGSGRAKKGDMAAAAAMEFDFRGSEHEVDAIGVALAALGMRKEQRLREA